MRTIIQSINPEHVYNMRVKQAGVPLKRIEVRKTAPMTPFKAYIYETKGKYKVGTGIFAYGLELQGTAQGRGKIVGEYICRRIDTVRADNAIAVYYNNKPETRITDEQLRLYGTGEPLKFLYMEDVIFYDTPKELSDFKYPCPSGYNDESNAWCYRERGVKLFMCKYNDYKNKQCLAQIKRAPQSWCNAELIDWSRL